MVGPNLPFSFHLRCLTNHDLVSSLLPLFEKNLAEATEHRWHRDNEEGCEMMSGTPATSDEGEEDNDDLETGNSRTFDFFLPGF